MSDDADHEVLDGPGGVDPGTTFQVQVGNPADALRIRATGEHFSEATWTKPRADCPHPERWHAADWDSTEVEVIEMVAGLIRGLQPDFVLETGTAFGDMAWAIGEALAVNGHGRLVTIEYDRERANAATDLFEKVPQVEVVCGSSLEYDPPEPIDFAWFDSADEIRVREFLRFRPYITEGSIVGFHDCGWHRRDLREQLEVMASRGYFRIIMPHTPRGVCLAQVLR